MRLSTLPLLAFLALPLAAQEWSSRVSELAAEGALDRALRVLDEHLSTHPMDAAAHRERARLLTRLVDEQGVTWLAMNDAALAWEDALAQDPYDLATVRGAMEARLRLGEYERAATLGLRALGTGLLEDAEPPLEILLLSCRARIGAYQRRDPEAPGREAELASLFRTLQSARQLAPTSIERIGIEATFLHWLGLPEQAVAVLSEALEKQPEASALHRQFIDLHVRAGIEARLAARYEVWCAEGTGPTRAWWAGYAHRLSGDLALRERRHADALAAYGRTRAWMSVAKTLEPDFRLTADQIVHQADVSSGWAALDAGHLEDARRRLLALVAEAPEWVESPDGLGRSALHALSALGERWVQRNDFRRASEDARAVVDALPSNGQWWNNLGFLLREYATQVETGAIEGIEDTAAASLEIYRHSWEAYQQAAALVPEDARIVNDAALLQIYHLREELDLAEKMEWQAIRIGEAQLEAMGPNPDEAERFPVAQAVGDAYQNLGYLEYHLRQNPQASRPHWEASIASDSGDRSYFVSYLDAIDGKREPIELDVAHTVPAPIENPPAPVRVAWEPSFSAARALASKEGRPLIVYQRGEALGLGIPYLDALVTSARFRDSTRGALRVVADRVRRTFVDRRHDGPRVTHPLWGTVTCAETALAADEFDAWYEAELGEVPGEAAEGFYLFEPAGGHRRLEPRELLALELQAPAPDSLPFEAIEASMAGAGGAAEAEALVERPGAAARAVVERVLWEGFASGEAQENLVAALGVEASEASLELLRACLRQEGNPSLAWAALVAWPEDAEPAPLFHALRWSREERVRARAAGRLAKQLPEHPAVVARRVLNTAGSR